MASSSFADSLDTCNPHGERFSKSHLVCKYCAFEIGVEQVVEFSHASQLMRECLRGQVGWLGDSGGVV